MAYTINKYSGEQLIVLEDGTIDTSTSVNLVGRNYVGYGEAQNENFVWMLENFSNDNPPSRPLKGQLWFDSSNSLLHVYDGVRWNLVGSAILDDNPPTEPTTGALWLRTPINTLNVYDGTDWRFIGPEAVPGFGTTRCRSASLIDSVGNNRPVIFLEINGTIIAISTPVAFTIDPSNSVANFENNLIAGINLSNLVKVKGDITGRAGSADRLHTARLINGTAFDGQENITVKAATPFKLKKGTYIIGSDFDGSSEITWNVEATSNNTIGKIVSRDSSGSFSAGTISATFNGTLNGNVDIATGTSRFNIVEANEFVGATLTGNAGSANKLALARKINGVDFDGTRNITITSAANTLTTDTLAANVVISSLTSVGTLSNLSVADAGVSIGTAGTLRFLVDSNVPTLRSTIGKLNFDMGSSGPDVSFIDSATSLSLGGPNAPAIVGDNTTNLGIPGYKFNNVYANNLIGNADTATSATTATNIAGGGAGAIPYQTAANTTTMLGLGTPGYVLKAQAGGIVWDAVNTEQLNKGSYVNMVNTVTSASVNYFNSSVPVTVSVDATSTNTASKVVARDASGNFAAGTITANLIGNVTGNTTGTHTGNVNGNVVGNVVGNLTGTASNATNASYSTNQPGGTSNTTIATTAFVQQEISSSRLRSLVLSSGTVNVTSPNSQYIDLIQAYMPANTVTAGAQFNLIINRTYASTSNSISASQWISAYQWGTLSVNSTTTLYDSTVGYRLIYQSNGSTWSYTGSWSYV